jgi:ubiquinol-cytochrome c reductase cytochrome b subunit
LSAPSSPAARDPQGWWEQRSGLRALLGRLSLRAPRAGSSLWRTLGGVLLLLLAIQLASGALLLVHFAPDPERAFASVRALMRSVPYGWLVRLVHVHAANLLVIALFVHLFHSAFSGAYKAPRELIWLTGSALFVLLLGAALTGYILPWSQTSYWATTVVSATFEHVPGIGDQLASLLRGGDTVGEATYRRAFASHVVLLPLAILGLAALHLVLVLREVPEPPHGAPAPGRVLRYARVYAAVLLVLFGGVFFAPNLFFPPDHFVPANPLETPPHVKPEWYFLWAYQLPRMLPAALAVGIQTLAVAGLFALPFLDRSASPRPAAWVTLGLAATLVGLVVLSVFGAMA